MLVLALARCVPHNEAVPILRAVFDSVPGHAAMALGEIGSSDDLTFLRSKVHHVKSWQQKEVSKAIRRIQRRGSSTSG